MKSKLVKEFIIFMCVLYINFHNIFREVGDAKGEGQQKEEPK